MSGDHNHSHTGNANKIAIAFAIIATFMVVEVVGGLLSGSLALLADAGHMVSDAAALGMSWFAIRVGQRPADAARSFGYKRLEVLAAFVNGLALFLIAGWITYEAVLRFSQPVPILGGPMLAVAIAGTVANLAAFWVISSGDRTSLNVQSAWLHILGDLFGSVAAIVAAGVILWTGWTPIDPLLSILVAVIILKSAFGIVRSSAHILLEGSPPEIELEALKADLATVIPPEAEIRHLHLWSLTAEQPLITLHVTCGELDRAGELRQAIRKKLKDGYQIGHSTIEVEAPEEGRPQSCHIAEAPKDHDHSH